MVFSVWLAATLLVSFDVEFAVAMDEAIDPLSTPPIERMVCADNFESISEVASNIKRMVDGTLGWADAFRDEVSRLRSW